MSDLVSVVVPVYKVEDVILNTLKSINAQTYKNIEVILVDDGTPDKSAVIAENYLKSTELDWKIIHKKNGGLAAARNTGIQNAKGEWVICPDSDDVIEPWTINEMLTFALNFKVDCVFCGYKSVTIEDVNLFKKEKLNGEIYQSREIRQLFLERKLKLLVTGMLVRKSVYSNLHFEPSCPYDEDIHFLWQLLFIHEKYGYIKNPYYHYFNRSTSMVHSLKPDNYLAASKCYDLLVKDLLKTYPEEKGIIEKIYPKYRLGGAHVLSKANTYEVFKDTVMKDGYRKDMSKLIFQRNLKLSAYSLLYCTSLRLFYYVSR